MGAEGSHTSNVPPPFLTKTYEMVDDPITDDIVSWSDNNNSFIVWSVADFTKDLLPQYFKHNNFSSFVRQLNTYGFHKIDPDRQEFANEGFFKGNKDGLKNIHRRKPSAPHPHSLHMQKDQNLIGCSDPAHVELEEEIKKLKHDKGLLLTELLMVRQQQQSTETELESLGQRLQALEERQQQMLTFLAGAMRNPARFQQFVQTQSRMSLAFNKKRRLPDQEALIGVGESLGVEDSGGQLVRYHSVDAYQSGDAGECVPAARLPKSEPTSEGSFERVLRQFAVSTLNNQSDETSPLSHTSGVTPWEISVDPSTGIGLPAQSGTMSHSGAGECSDSACEKRDCRDFKRDPEEETQANSHEQDGVKATKASGSNDVFWESLLTENPRLTQKDSDDVHPNERWFL